MSETLRLVWRISGFAAIVCLLALTAASLDRVPTYGRFVGAGGYSVVIGDVIMNIASFLTAGDFFEGMERRATGSVNEFRKSGQKIEAYPPEMQVLILVVPIKRGWYPVPKALSDPNLGRDFASSLRFDLQWKRGLAMRPAEVRSLDFRDKLPVEGLWPFGVPTKSRRDRALNEWSWEIKVISKDVPLTDHLVITVYARDGARLTRFSAVL